MEAVLLRSGDVEAAVVPERGGLVTRLRIGDHDLLYLDESTLLDPTRNVRGGIPVLFPFAGRLTGDAFAWGGRTGRLGQHGFGRNLPWRAADRTPDAVELVLASSDATRAGFPWAFEGRLRVAVRDGALHLRLGVTNTDEAPLPFAPGFHPYFQVPDARKADARVLGAGGRARDNRTGALVDDVDLTLAEADLHFLDPVHGAGLRRPDGRTVDVAFDGYLVVWTLAGRDFVCVEPWGAPADALNTGAARAVAPGETAAFEVAISLR